MKSLNATIYSAKDLSNIPWPDNADGDYARRFLSPWLKAGCSHFIKNVKTDLYIIIVGTKALPLTVNNQEYANSYVASPYCQYVSYLLYELKELNSPLVASILSILIKLYGVAFKHCKIDKVATVNNWLLSTNLHLNYTEKELKAISHEVKKHFPEHALYFRSVSAFNSEKLYHQLLKLGLTPILGRSVYLQTPEIAQHKRSIKNDVRLLKKSDYKQVSHDNIEETDLLRINKLYNDLYLDKWSKLNPQFTLEFYQNTHQNRTLHYTVFTSPKGSIDSVCGYFIRNGMITTPVLGFDTQKPMKFGLYRMACFIPYHTASSKDLLVHCSSGAADFKRTRGAKQYLEYNFVDLSSLSFIRKIPWYFLARISPFVARKLLSLKL